MAKRDPNRTQILRFRILPAEGSLFASAAKAVGLELADWVRSELLRAANRDLHHSPETPETRRPRSETRP